MHTHLTTATVLSTTIAIRTTIQTKQWACQGTSIYLRSRLTSSIWTITLTSLMSIRIESCVIRDMKSVDSLRPRTTLRTLITARACMMISLIRLLLGAIISTSRMGARPTFIQITLTSRDTLRSQVVTRLWKDNRIIWEGLLITLIRMDLWHNNNNNNNSKHLLIMWLSRHVLTMGSWNPKFEVGRL